MTVGPCVLCFGLQIFLDLSCIVFPPVSSSPSVFRCLPLSSSLSCLLVPFVGPHLCFVLGNMVWGVKSRLDRGRQHRTQEFSERGSLNLGNLQGRRRVLVRCWGAGSGWGGEVMVRAVAQGE